MVNLIMEADLIVNIDLPGCHRYTLTRINRKYETRNSKYETNPKFKNSNVSNEINVVTKLSSIQTFVNACLSVLYEDANKCFAQFA